MEDISRELEREIARAKPTPYKTNKKKNVLVVDDFGRMKSGGYLWVLVRFLAVTSLVFGVAAAGLYYLYEHQTQEVAAMEKRLVMLEKKKKQLTNEKEILMARLVMSGDKPVLGKADAAKTIAKSSEIKAKKTEVKKTKQEVASIQTPPPGVAEKLPEPVGLVPEVKQAVEKPTPSADAGTGDETGGDAKVAADTGNGGGASGQESHVIAVEKFSVSQSPDHEELRVKFNIRNIKEAPGEISGRIFLVLKPEGGGKDDWIIAPKAPLSENGIPSVYKRGQYFSISRFKPVKFTINSRIAPERLKMTGVFIFDDEGQLIFNDMVETSLDEDQ